MQQCCTEKLGTQQKKVGCAKKIAQQYTKILTPGIRCFFKKKLMFVFLNGVCENHSCECQGFRLA
jgi:hypothetical protein